MALPEHGFGCQKVGGSTAGALQAPNQARPRGLLRPLPSPAMLLADVQKQVAAWISTQALGREALDPLLAMEAGEGAPHGAGRRIMAAALHEWALNARPVVPAGYPRCSGALAWVAPC